MFPLVGSMMDAKNIYRIHVSGPSDAVDKQAREWVIRFNQDTPPTEQDIQSMKDWVALDPAHHQALKKAEQLWSEADSLGLLAVPHSAPSFSERLRSRFKPKRFPPVAAAIILVAFLALGLVYSNAGQDGVVGDGIYATKIGELVTLTLSDKTQVVLDTASKIHVRYEDHARVITLLSGKAHFQVVKNPQRPFYVRAHAGAVRAVGTAFSVTLQSEGFKVAVDEGKVELSRSEHRQAEMDLEEEVSILPVSDLFVLGGLEAGETATLYADDLKVSQLNALAMKKELSWKKGILFFNGEPLSEVIAELSRYTDVKIDVADSDLNQLKIGGRFKVGELEALFEVLEVGFGVDAEFIDKRHVTLRYSEKPSATQATQLPEADKRSAG